MMILTRIYASSHLIRLLITYWILYFLSTTSKYSLFCFRVIFHFFFSCLSLYWCLIYSLIHFLLPSCFNEHTIFHMNTILIEFIHIFQYCALVPSMPTFFTTIEFNMFCSLVKTSMNGQQWKQPPPSFLLLFFCFLFLHTKEMIFHLIHISTRIKRDKNKNFKKTLFAQKRIWLAVLSAKPSN